MEGEGRWREKGVMGWRGGEGGWEGREGWREKMRGREKEAGFQS